MNIDHRDFILKHHKSAQRAEAGSSKKNRGSGIWLLIALFVLATQFFIFLFHFSGLPDLLKVSSILVFSVLSIIGFFIYRVSNTSKKREEELDLIRAVMEGSRGARLITDSDDKTLYTNDKFELLCRGVGPPSFNSLSRLFEGHDEAAAHFRMLADQAHRGLTDSIELFSKFEDNERWLLVTVQPIAEHPGHVHWRIDDVTDKHSIEIAIRDEREKLIDFTDNAPVGFFAVDERGRFVFANATLARWLGEDLQQLLDSGKLHTYLLEPPEKAQPYDIMEGGRMRQIAELKMKGVAGKTFLASVNQTIVKEPGGKVRTRAVVHDLTAEKEMRQALQASEDRFRRFFEEAPLGIVLINSKGKIADCNVSFAAMMDRDIHDLEQQPFNDLLHEQDRHAVLDAFDKIEKGDRLDKPIEVSLKNSEGDIIATQMHARRFKTSGNIVLHFIDLSEKRALEAQFEQSQKMQAVGQLAGGVAHDFNNLLTAMIGFCDLLLLRHKPGDPSFGDIMQIKQNANRAANLVRQLLAFSRQQTLRPKVLDVSDVLTELSHLMRRLIGSSIDLDLIHGQHLGLIKVDEGQMEQVLINLAVNARDAMERGGELTIETENFENEKPIKLVSEEMPAGQWVQIKVTDNGCGIPKENLDRIFEPFFTTKEVGEGTGLGLATVYGIIRQTGGFLDVESEVDKGTSFLIYLPRIDESELEEEADDGELEDMETKDLTGTECILLVEDEDAVRTFSTRALSNKGYEVLAAENGEHALKTIEAQGNKPLDLLITDVVMPGMDGPTLAQRIRQNSPNMKIIFISGYTEDKLKDHMGDNIYFLPKPFTLKQLAQKVKEVLED